MLLNWNDEILNLDSFENEDDRILKKGLEVMCREKYVELNGKKKIAKKFRKRAFIYLHVYCYIFNDFWGNMRRMGESDTFLESSRRDLSNDVLVIWGYQETPNRNFSKSFVEISKNFRIFQNQPHFWTN